MMHLSKQEHAVQQIDSDGTMIGISRQWYEEAKAQLAAYENTGLDPEQVAELAIAYMEGRMVVLPPFADENHDGLKTKYFVYEARNGELLDNCFVLRPKTDRYARYALLSYAAKNPNKRLGDDLTDWICEIMRKDRKTSEDALAAQEGSHDEL